MIKVMIVDSDSSFLSRLRGIIDGTPDMQLFAAVQDGATARSFLDCGEPDVLLLGLGLPDLSTMQLIKYAVNIYQALRIMVVTVNESEQQVLTCIESGVTGFLLKNSLDREFVCAINQLQTGGSPISPPIARLLLKKLCKSKLVEDNGNPPNLSPRESEMLALLAKGLRYMEIAHLLEVSPHTVTTTIKRIYRKLAVHSRGEAIYEASRIGLIS